MLEWMLTLDRELFLKINRDWNHPWADAFFPYFTDLHHTPWFPAVFIAWLAFMFYRGYGARKAVGLFLGMALCLATTDFLGGKVIKPYFERKRPTITEADGVTRGKEYGGYSFTSNHASNTFAGAVYLVQWIPQGRIVFLAIAVAVAYSRVYVGVHYPLDVVGGAFLGVFMALLWCRIMEKILRARRPVP